MKTTLTFIAGIIIGIIIGFCIYRIVPVSLGQRLHGLPRTSTHNAMMDTVSKNISS